MQPWPVLHASIRREIGLYSSGPVLKLCRAKKLRIRRPLSTRKFRHWNPSRAKYGPRSTVSIKPFHRPNWFRAAFFTPLRHLQRWQLPSSLVSNFPTICIWTIRIRELNDCLFRWTKIIERVDSQFKKSVEIIFNVNFHQSWIKGKTFWIRKIRNRESWDLCLQEGSEEFWWLKFLKNEEIRLRTIKIVGSFRVSVLEKDSSRGHR